MTKDIFGDLVKKETCKHRCIDCKKITVWEIWEVVHRNGMNHTKGECKECGQQKLLPKERTYEESILYFGKHKGKNITEIPPDYLVWALEKDVIGGGLAWKTLEYLKEIGVPILNYRTNNEKIN